METGRFYTNSSSEIAQKFRSLQVKFAIEQEKQVRKTKYTLRELTCIETTGNR